jgi:SMC interacting uncharacterized protein involved in chromosome segregation
MADLDAAADAALAKVKELSGHVDDAREACTELRDEASRLKGEMEADWDALHERAKALLDSVPEQRTQLDQEAQQATRSLGELAGAVASAGGEGEQLQRTEAAQVTAFGDQAEGLRPQVTAMIEQAESALRSLAQQAAEMESALTEAVAEARAFVEGEAREQLSAMKDSINEGAEELRRALAEESTAALDEAFSTWEAKLGELEGFVEKAFEDAGQHVEDVVTYSLKECAKGHTEAIDELVQVMDATLAPAIETLEAAVEQATSEVEGAESGLEVDFEETAKELEAALAALQHVKELLASYSFVNL